MTITVSITVSITTLGNGADAVIRSITASGANEDEFERVVDIDSCLALGLTVDGRSLCAWKDGGEEAIAVPLREALLDLQNAFSWEDTHVLMNMGLHHAAVLDTAYRRLGLNAPWQFYNLRDILSFEDKACEQYVRQA